MFPEYRDLITRLKSEDAHFNNLFDEHNELDQRIKNMEARIIPGTDTEIETLKKENCRSRIASTACSRTPTSPDRCPSLAGGATHSRLKSHM